HPAGAFLELRLKVVFPFGDGRATGAIDVMIRLTLAHVLPAPARLGWVFRIIDPTIGADQIQERRRIPLDHARTGNRLGWVDGAERAMVADDVFLNPLTAVAAEHALIGF